MTMQDLDPSQRVAYASAAMLTIRLNVLFLYVDSHDRKMFSFEHMVDSVSDHATIGRQDTITLFEAMQSTIQCLEKAYKTKG